MVDSGNVNNVRWKIGWSPWIVIIGVTVVFALVGVAVDRIGPFLALGILSGIITWYYGVREINAKYQSFVEQFVGESERNAKRGIDIEDAKLYNLTYNSGSSPLLVTPSDNYYNTTIVISETSINLNEGAEYDMESRSGVGGGTNKELYYDQVTGVQSHQDGTFTELEIKTSGGESTRISSVATDTVDQIVSEVRQRVRETKNPQGSQRQRGDPEPATETTAQTAASGSATPDSQTDSSSVTTAVQDGDSDTATAHPVTEISAEITSDTRVNDPLAAELCRALSADSPDRQRIESALADVIDRLEHADAVADVVAGLENPTDERQIESMRRSLAALDGPIADGMEPALDRLGDAEAELESHEPTVTSRPSRDQDHREKIDELQSEIDQYQQRYDRLETAAGGICRDATQMGTISFRSSETEERLVELADALETGDLVFDTPGRPLATIVEDVKRSVRPQTPQSRDLLDAVGGSNWTADEISAVLESTVTTVDQFAEPQAAIADIQIADVRRRIDSLDSELKHEEEPVYRHLADRVREMEVMIDEGIDDVQLYAIYQESTFYDRTLVPRLSRSDGSHRSSDDVLARAREIDNRITSVNDEYISVKVDYNHTIPNHFLSLANTLCDQARRIGDQQPQRAVGQLAAASELLDHVEELYERNEYSVMLRRLRG